jgi:uncharacterized protein YqhQ
MQVGGQAVLEGVMMRAPGMVATAVRRANGSVVIRKEPYTSLAERSAFWKLFILRGAVGLVEMLAIGIRTLNFSAEVAMEDVEENHSGTSSRGNGSDSTGKSVMPKSGGIRLALTVAFAFFAGMVLFFGTPLVVTTVLFDVNQDPVRFNLIAGVIRVSIFLGYLWGISLMKDVQRLFQYHGAEHKAVFAFEKGEDLSVAGARRQSRFHPRCGTSFLLIVMIVAIILFALLDAVLIHELGRINIVIRIATHLPLLPLVGGVSYEFIKLSARKSETPLGRLVVAPGLWLQRITTREPNDGQIEVAIAALHAALGMDEHRIPRTDAPKPQPFSVN